MPEKTQYTTEDAMNEKENLDLMRVVDVRSRFIKRYLPDDPYLRDEFSRDLDYLIHLIYREAQLPLMKQMTEFAMRFTPMLFPTTPDKSK